MAELVLWVTSVALDILSMVGESRLVLHTYAPLQPLVREHRLAHVDAPHDGQQLDHGLLLRRQRVTRPRLLEHGVGLLARFLRPSLLVAVVVIDVAQHARGVVSTPDAAADDALAALQLRWRRRRWLRWRLRWRRLGRRPGRRLGRWLR